MSKEELSRQIEAMRERLNDAVDRKIDYEQILKISKEMDRLIAAYMSADAD
ncbi:MAG: aspartyl-phosphate phosphatase Spo0E family protein [bacterium]|nr:aspartyl-phosphate phosphatase Spo0E family protein [bacterium]